MFHFCNIKSKLKNQSGIVVTDVVLAVITIMIFSILMISLMYNNSIENIKIKQQGLAIAEITETFENIGIADYNQVTQQNINTFISKDAERNGISIALNVAQVGDEDILRKITATASYKIADKTYTYSMERMKVKR